MSTALAEKIEQLSPEIQKEIEELVDKLLNSREGNTQCGLNLSWRGALKDLRDKYTSVELQHEAHSLWMKNVSSR